MKTFKGLPVCKKHGITYKWREGCKACKKQKNRGKTELDLVVDKMKKDGLIPETEKDDKDGNDNN